MLKIRLQGTTKDLKWFLKMLARDKRFVANKPSEPMDIKGNFEAFENTLDQIVTSRIIDMIPVLAEENEIEESECKAIFGIQYYFIRLLFNAYNNEMSFLKGRHFVIIGDRVLNSK